MIRLIVVALLFAGLAAGCREQEPAVETTQSQSATSPAETVAAPAVVAEPSGASAASHDVTGGYFAMAPVPAEFADLDHLSLATIDENAAPAPLNGFLRPKEASRADYVLENPRIEGLSLTFTTSRVDGIHYEFSGEFSVLGNFPADPPDPEAAVLAGTLTRLRDGKILSSTPVRFQYSAGG